MSTHNQTLPHIDCYALYSPVMWLKPRLIVLDLQKQNRRLFGPNTAFFTIDLVSYFLRILQYCTVHLPYRLLQQEEFLQVYP